MLLRKFVKCSPGVKCYLFKTYCCNLYCAPFWYDSTKTAMKNLKVAYNNSLRRLLGLPSVTAAVGVMTNDVTNYSLFWYFLAFLQMLILHYVFVMHRILSFLNNLRV